MDYRRPGQKQMPSPELGTKFPSNEIFLPDDANQSPSGSTQDNKNSPGLASPHPDPFSPSRLLFLTVVSVLIAEVSLNVLVNFFEFQSNISVSLVDAAITTVFTFPIIYFLLFRRIRTQYLQLKKLESSLEITEAAFREIVQDQSELICRLDRDQNIVFVNQAFKEYFSWEPEKFKGLKFTAFFEEAADKIKDQILNLNADHPLERRDYQQITPDGTTHWLSLAIRAFYDDAGQITHYQAVGRDITGHKKILAELEDAQLNLEMKIQLRTAQINQMYGEVLNTKAKLKALSHKLVEVQELERRNISRELHDETSQALVSLVFALEIIKREAGDPVTVAARVDELDRLIGDILNKLDRLVRDLRPASLDHLGLMPAIRQYVDGMRGKSGIEIQLHMPELAERLPSDLETSLYRIIQEGLANIILHAQASQVEIRLEIWQDAIHVHINDDGIGFNVDEALENGRLGLFGMRERAEMIGGKLDIQSSPGFGTRLALEVPYDFSDRNRR
jgi:PAS domain S-box-containing protein